VAGSLIQSDIDYYGTGRRKTSVARVRLVPGQGRIIVNSRPVEDYFPSPMVRADIVTPLRLAHVEDKFDVIVRVSGGGFSSQGGAVRHGIARALLTVDADRYRPILKRAGLLRRDPRMKERRKYGLKKARKAPQFSKR